MISNSFSVSCFFLLFSTVATFYHWLERQFQTFFYLFDILASVSNQTTQFVWSLHEFLQIDHFFIFLLSNLDRRTVEILIARSYKSSRTRVQNVVYSSQWVDDVISLQNVLNQFRIDTVDFRQSDVFRSFSIRFELIASSITSSSSLSSVFRVQLSSEQSLVFRLDIFIRFGVSTTIQLEAFTSSRFRRNNNSEIRESIFSSIVSSYSSIINFDFDLNISRQSIVESNITSNELRSINIQTDNNQTFLFIQTEEIRRSMFSIISSSIEVNQILWNDIMIVIIVFATIFRFANETFSVDNNTSQSAVKFAENVDYFDFDYENSFDTNQLIVSSKRHNFYRDVFIFTDHLKNLKKTFFDFRMKKLIFTCLKRDALIWYNTKFTEIEKNFFKKTNIERWCAHLIKRFKKRTSIALKKLQIEIYIYVDARRDRKSRFYMQNIFRHVKAANFSSVFYQCTIAWSNLELNFRAQISESSKNIILFIFLSQLDAKKSVWMNMTARHRDNSDQNFSNNVDRSNNRSSKQNRNRDDFSQQFYVSFFYSNQAYMWSFSSYNSYQFRNSVYQFQSNYQSRQSTENYQQKFFDASIVLSTAKQFLLLKFSSGFVSISNQKINKSSNARRFEKFDKVRVYNIDEETENEFEKNFLNQDDFDVDDHYVDDYHASKEIFYYQSFSYNDFENEDDNVVYLIISKVFSSESDQLVICKKCGNSFSFNNKFHDHIRFVCSSKNIFAYFTKVFSKSFFIIMTIQSFKFTVITRSSVRKLSAINSSSITPSGSTTILSDTSKPVSISISTLSREFKSTSIFIIVSDVDFSKNVDTDHDFRDWNYARIHVVLFFTVDVESVCLDIDAEIVFCDRQFFKKQTSNVFIKIMITFISIRDLDVDKHMTIEYVILFMYFSGQKDGVTIKAKIIKKIHLIDNFKTNMLLSNDVIESKKIDVSISNKSVYIDNCEIIVSFEVRTSRVIIQISIHARKITMIFSHSELIFSMHYITVSFDRDYLFESDEFNFSLYAHLVDSIFKHIVVRNENNQVVHIFRNCRVDHMIEIDFINVFQIYVDQVSEIVDLAFRRSIRAHKISWFKKIIVAIYVAINIIASIVESTFAIVVSTSKAFHSFTLSQREIFTQLDVQFSSVCYSDFQFLVFANDTSKISNLSHNVKFVKFVAKIVFENDVIIHRFSKNVVKIFTILIFEYLDLWKNIDFAQFFQKNWMRISLKSDWEQRIFGKTKIYSLNKKNREFVDEIFDKLHESNRFSWTNEFISFSYFVFCVWKKINDQKKNRSIVDIRDFNAIIQSNVYFLFLQFNIIFAVIDCQYIIVLNCSIFFYQWKVHSENRHKLTVVTHRDQESFNVAVMSYKNSSTYVQRQIDRFFRFYRVFAKVYVNDIVIHFSILQKHFAHLTKIFDMLRANNISIKFEKIFIDYFTVHLFDQKVDSFELVTVEKKLKAISRLFFFITLQLLETYLEFTSWLRDYVSWYVEIFKSLQQLKTELFHGESVIGNVRKIYSRNIKIKNFTFEKIVFFQILQSLLIKLFYFVHSNLVRKLFVNFDFNKKFGLVDMIYHVKNSANWNDKEYSFRKFIEFILFLSRFLIDVEIRYWSTELKLVDIVWVLKKIKHLVDSFEQRFTIIFTNHDAVLNLIKQTSLIIVFIDKFNLRLIRVFDYIQRFEIELRHKSNKQHIVFDVLSRLVSINIDTIFEEDELNALFIIVFVKMKTDFR